MTLSGRYELREVIGTGGMSDVYEATDTILGRTVAVKMLRPELARDVKFKERFRREAQNSGRLNHPAIVQVYDTGEIDLNDTDVPYIVMERVHGRTLRDIVRSEGPLAPADAAKILISVCEALQASHDAGVIHRDIKPANIMITNTGAVKVMDFGIARALDDVASAMTQTSAVIGTAQYLSPEQARGKAADARSDVYATGCVFYEMITGRPPFEGDSPFAVAYQHVQEDPEPPSAFIPDLSPTTAVNIDAVALTAMAKHPADRYQTASEFAEDLTRVSRNAVSNAARIHLQDPEPEAERTTVLDQAQATDQPTAIVPQVMPDSIPSDIADRPTTVTPKVRDKPYAATESVPSVMQQNPTAQAFQTAGSNKDGSPHSDRKKRPALRWLVGLLMVAALIGGGIFTYDFITHGFSPPGESHSVPDVAGLSESDATSQLEGAGFKVEVTQQTSPTVARGMAISTNPTAGSSVRSHATVTLVVSSGKEITEVPNVSGKTTQEAQQILSNAGLELDNNVKEASSNTVNKDAVIEQSPPAGSQVSKGTKVILTVSTGPAQVRVPAVNGMKWEQAQGNFTALNLKTNVTEVDSELPQGTVISTSGEGTMVDKGTTIQVQVSNGQMIKVPALTGKTVSQAADALRAAGWQGTESSITQEPVGTAAFTDQGKIAYQNPDVNGLIRKNGKVTVGVFRFDLLAGH